MFSLLIFYNCILACSKQFIEATGKTECEEWLVDEDSKIVSVLTSGEGSGDYLFKIISSMVGLAQFVQVVFYWLVLG